MKIVTIERIIDRGKFSQSATWRQIEQQLIDAIHAVDWPVGSGLFTLYDEPGKKRGMGSGVKPIKLMFMEKLSVWGWRLETPVAISAQRRPGPMDATFPVDEKLFCVEWETGNISSSHRALNKMALGILKKILIGGVLILPTGKMYQYLTDRVGNYPEIEPYFHLWQALNIEEGLLVAIAVEHDAVSTAVPRISKGTDGRALW